MSITVNLNGSPYTVPSNGDTYAWGAPLTQYLQAISLEMLQKNTPLFAISQDLSFGTSFGLIVKYLKSGAAIPASAGELRLGKDDTLEWRNTGNTGNVVLGISALDELTLNGVPIVGIAVIDNLTSFSTVSALSANQGRILNELIAATGGASGIADVVLRSNIEKTGGDYPIGDQLILSEALVNRVKISGNLAVAYTSPAVAININWNGVPPIAPFIMQIYDPAGGGDTELLYVDTFVNESPAGQFNYTCAALTFSYPITTTVVTNSGLAIGSNSASLDETLVSDALDNSYNITKSRFKVAPFTGDMDWQHRWWGESFPVESTTATTLVLTDVAPNAAGSHQDMFLSGDKIIFFPKIWNGISYDPVYDSTLANNFKEITLTANGSWAANQLTLTHASGDNNHFLPDTDFFVARKSAHFLYSAGDGTSTNIATEPVVDEFFPVARGNFGFFQDTFDRANGAIGNNWTQSAFTFDILTNELRINNGGVGVANGYRTLEDYSLSKLPIEIYVEARRPNANKTDFFTALGGDGSFIATSGFGISFDFSVAGLANFYENGVVLSTSAIVQPSNGDYFNFRLQYYKTKMRFKFWNITLGQVEPSTWVEDDNGSTPYAIATNEGRLWVGNQDVTSATGNDIGINYISISPVDQGFISSGTVTGLTSVSQITGYSRLERNDSKDKPIIFQRDIKVKPD